MNKKINFGVVALFLLVFFSVNVSADFLPSTSPCRVIGSVAIGGSAAPDGLTVNAVPSVSSAKSTATSGGNYNLNAVGATSGETVTLNLCGISTGLSFAFVPYCNSSATEPWITKNIDFTKKSDGTRGCTCDTVCTGGHCVNPGATGVCSSNTYYCDSDGVCESAFGETTSTCSADCPSSSGGSSSSGSQNGGGGGGGGGGSYSGGSSGGNESFDTGNGTIDLIYTRSVSYSPSSNTSTYSLTIVNNGDVGTGPLTIREHIPSNVANDSSSLTFSIPPDSFEHGSVIAVWNLLGGIPAHQSFAVSYSVAKQTYVLSGFGIAFNKTAPPAEQPAPPAQQPAQNVTQQPVQQPAKPPPVQQPASQPAQQPSQAPEQQAQPQVQQPEQGPVSALVLVIGVLIAIAVAAGIIYYLVLMGRKREQ